MNKGFPFAMPGKRVALAAVRFGGMKIAPLLALAALGCGDKFSSEGAGGTGGGLSSQVMGAAEIRLSPPRSDIPNIGARTSCAAGTTGTYTYLLGAASQGLTAQDRVRSGMLKNGSGIAVSCFVSDDGEDIHISASIAGKDANSRHVPASLELSGAIPSEVGWGALGNGTVSSDDTGELAADPSVAVCVLDAVVVSAPGSLTADIVCPALVSDSASAGCEARGAISLSGCSH